MKYFRYTLDDLEKSANRKLFTYISFFAGGGGSSAGYKLAGGDCKFVNEFQQVAVDTYLANWPDTPHICGDIKNVTGKQIMEMTGLKKGELDILDELFKDGHKLEEKVEALVPKITDHQIKARLEELSNLG